MSDDNFRKKLESLDNDFNKIQENFSEGEIVFDGDNEPTVSIKKTADIRFDKLDKEYSNTSGDDEKNDEQMLGDNNLIGDEDDYEEYEDEIIVQRSKKMYIIGAFILLLILGLSAFFLLNTPDKLYGQAYNKGIELMLNQQYYEAIEQFNKAGNYKDSLELTRECRYQYGLDLFEKQNYNSAREIFSVLTSYKDSDDYYKEATYLYAKEQITAGEYFKALELFSEISNYKDVQIILSNDLFSTGLLLLQQEKYEKAYQYFKSISDVKNRDLCIAICETYLFEKSEEEIDEDTLLHNFNLCRRSSWDIAQTALQNSVYTCLKLSGEWVDEDSTYYFNCNDGFEFNIPINNAESNPKFKFKNDTILQMQHYNQRADKRVWTVCFKIIGFDPVDALAPNSVTIQCVETQEVYKLTRKS